MKYTNFSSLGLIILRSILFISPLFFTQKFTPARHHESGMDKAMEQEYFLTRDPNVDEVPRERLIKAEQFRVQKISEQSGLYSPVTGINWTERGPSNIGGRTRAVCFDLNGAPLYKKVWAGGVSGGLWYTNDITATNVVWNKVNDFMDNLAITTIGQGVSNPQVMYVGTGEGWYNFDAVRGMGIWRSLDGGSSWSQLASTNNSSFYYTQKIIVDNLGNVYACTRNAGLQKSSDGGISWTKILGAGVNNGVSNNASDIEMAPNGDLYCSFGIFTTGKLYRSSDMGASWTDITPALSAQRIEIAVCPSSSDTVYALFENPSTNDCGAIRRYRVSTSTWVNCAIPTIVDQGANSVFTRGQAWYDLIASVDPNNPSVLYIGGVDALRSNDAGASWTQMTTWTTSGAPGFNQEVHADQHAIVYAPGSSSRALWGTDGGIYYTENANTATGKPDLKSKNNGYNITQYYAGALHPTKADYFLGGTQDNGSHKFSNPGINAVSEVSGGDGAFCHIDQDNPSVQITSYVYNNYFVSTNGGNTFNAIFKNDRGFFINPTDYDDAANILYGGDNGGYYFRWNSPGANGADQQVQVTAFNGGKVTHVKVSPTTPNRVYFGLSNGSVVRVDNANTGLVQTGTMIKASGTGSISCIAIDPANENHLLVSYSNYGVTSVLECINALQSTPSWTSIEGDLPDMPVRWAMFDPRNSDWAILATELGVWSTNDINGTATSWSPTNNGFANVRVDMLDYRSSDGVLLAVTHGRGMFTAVIPKPTTPDINFASSYTIVTESQAATDSCKGYKDHSIVLNIANAPVGNATVTVSLDNTNTASRPFDFEFTTNGNFVSPSSVLTFLSGSTASQLITVRIYDDADLENNEFFTLKYTIGGTTNAQPGTGAQQHTIYINDNDAAPAAGSLIYFNVGTPSFYLTNSLAGTGNGQPFDARLQKKKTRFQYRADELTNAGLTSGSITSLALNLGIVNSKRSYKNLQIRMGNSSVPNLVDNGSATIEQVTTYANIVSFDPVQGWNSLELATPFVWNGSSNVIVELCYDNGSTDTTDRADIAVGYKDGASNIQGNMFWQDNLDCSNNFTAPVFYAEGLKPQIKFGQGVPSTPVATVLNTSRTVYLGPNAEVFVYSSASEILARIKNLSSHDYGCTQVRIDREGTGAKPFLNNISSNYLMDKTIQVIPSNNTITGSYEVTLYFTGNEVSGWETITGQSFQNIQLVKVQGKIADVSPSNPNGGGTIQYGQAVKGAFGTSKTLTYTFNSGFSGFGAGIPGSVLPQQIIDFTGIVRNNAAILDWSSLFERGTNAYSVERSYDGIQFKKIGTVAASGNSDMKKSYRYVDKELAQENNFYRIRAIDLDGRETLTQTLLLRNPMDPSSGFRVLSNPVSDNLDLHLGNLSKGKWVCRIYDISGKRLIENPIFNEGIQRIRIDLSSRSMAAGIYLVEISNGRKVYAKRFVKR